VIVEAIWDWHRNFISGGFQCQSHTVYSKENYHDNQHNLTYRFNSYIGRSHPNVAI